jgi:hypothetical protein
MPEIVFADRYQALGIPYPKKDTMCLGQCDGTGWVPVKHDEENPIFKALWEEAHAKAHTITQRIKIAVKHKDAPWLWHRCDGWHFVKCPDCNGAAIRSLSPPTTKERT